MMVGEDVNRWCVVRYLFCSRLPAIGLLCYLVSLAVETPVDADINCSWALEPRFDHTHFQWFEPQEIKDSDRTINLMNTSDEPVIIPKHSHVAQIRRVDEVSIPPVNVVGVLAAPLPATKSPAQSKLHSDCISVNPSNLVPSSVVQSVRNIHRMYDNVFRPKISVYNGHSGNIQCHINMGPVKPPQRKARLPHYDHEKMVLLQQYFDDLEDQVGFVKPEGVGVIAEYMNM